MKPIKDYINQNQFETCLFETLINHINCEMFLRYGSFYSLKLNESLGRFENCIEVVKYIVDKNIIDNESFINKENYEANIDCKSFGVFFDTVLLTVEFSNKNNAEYYESNGKCLKIKVNVDGNADDNEIKSLVLHELLHAYEDYNRKKNGKPSIFDYFSDEYIKSYNWINSYSDIGQGLGRCKYFLNDQERNAYFSNLYSTIESLIGKHSIDHFDYNRFKNELKETDIWKIFFDCGEFISRVKSFNETEQKNLMSRYKYLTGNELTVNQIYKELDNKWRKFYRKFNQLVPKIICDIIYKTKIYK